MRRSLGWAGMRTGAAGLLCAVALSSCSTESDAPLKTAGETSALHALVEGAGERGTDRAVDDEGEGEALRTEAVDLLIARGDEVFTSVAENRPWSASVVLAAARELAGDPAIREQLVSGWTNTAANALSAGAESSPVLHPLGLLIGAVDDAAKLPEREISERRLTLETMAEASAATAGASTGQAQAAAALVSAAYSEGFSAH